MLALALADRPEARGAAKLALAKAKSGTKRREFPLSCAAMPAFLRVCEDSVAEGLSAYWFKLTRSHACPLARVRCLAVDNVGRLANHHAKNVGLPFYGPYPYHDGASLPDRNQRRRARTCPLRRTRFGRERAAERANVSRTFCSAGHYDGASLRVATHDAGRVRVRVLAARSRPSPTALEGSERQNAGTA